MAAAPAPGWTGALGLLERAVGYTRVSLHAIAPADLKRPTPCAGWDLAALLRHMSDSLAALREAADVGEVRLSADVPADPVVHVATARCPDADLVSRIRDQACWLLGAWTKHDGAQLVRIAGSPMTAAVLASTGALEITVHGWDVAQACGRAHPLPPLLAAELFDLVPLLVRDADRPGRFAAPIRLDPSASVSDRLLAVLGRRVRRQARDSV
jgi:uncharacterized protein (TIGR03086 family)